VFASASLGFTSVAGMGEKELGYWPQPLRKAASIKYHSRLSCALESPAMDMARASILVFGVQIGTLTIRYSLYSESAFFEDPCVRGTNE
jgi:hypothetical protein